MDEVRRRGDADWLLHDEKPPIGFLKSAQPKASAPQSAFLSIRHGGPGKSKSKKSDLPATIGDAEALPPAKTVPTVIRYTHRDTGTGSDEE